MTQKTSRCRRRGFVGGRGKYGKAISAPREEEEGEKIKKKGDREMACFGRISLPPSSSSFVSFFGLPPLALLPPPPFGDGKKGGKYWPRPAEEEEEETAGVRKPLTGYITGEDHWTNPATHFGLLLPQTENSARTKGEKNGREGGKGRNGIPPDAREERKRYWSPPPQPTGKEGICAKKGGRGRRK